MSAPVRMCRVCRKRSLQSEMVRWTIQEGRPVRDQRIKHPGRGLYTDSDDCAGRLELALRKRGK